MGKSFLCRTLHKDDEGSVERLVESTFSSFMGGRFWAWKYRQNPAFDYSLVAVAEENGKLIGCNHWLRRRFKVSESVEVDGILAADIAVCPEYRRMGVGQALMQFLRTSEATKKERTAVVYMFADPGLSKRFHIPSGGYVSAPEGTVTYTKVLNWNKVKENASSFEQAAQVGKFGKRLEGVNVSVLFKVRCAPPLFLYVSKDGADVYEKEAACEQDANVVIISDVTTLSRIKKKSGRVRSLFWALLTGKLRVGGRLTKILHLYKNLWVLEELLGGKIT
jgi:predicted N-acetyltransferase YhbS